MILGVAGILVIASTLIDRIAAADDPSVVSSASVAREPDSVFHKDVVEFLSGWNTAIADGDLQTLRDSYSAADGFVWFEDGEARYRSREAIVAARQAFPPGTAIETQLSSVTTRELAGGEIWMSAAFETALAMPNANISFGGVFTALLEEQDGRLVFASGHTSSMRTDERPGG